VIFNTFQGGNDYSPIFDYLGILADAVGTTGRWPHVFFACRALGAFLDVISNVRQRYPFFTVSIMTYHPAQASNLVTDPRFVPLRWSFSGVVVNIPFYFGPDEPEPPQDDVVRILAVGSLNGAHRDYKVISQLRRLNVTKKVELAFFPLTSADPTTVASLKRMTKYTNNVDVVVYGGNFTDLCRVARSSAFVAVYVDSASISHDSYYVGKRPAPEIAVATGFVKPLIASYNLLYAYGIQDQFPFDSTGGNFGAQLVAAVNAYGTDRYDAMRRSLCAYRTRRFVEARDHIASVLRRRT